MDHSVNYLVPFNIMLLSNMPRKWPIGPTRLVRTRAVNLLPELRGKFGVKMSAKQAYRTL